MKKGVVAAGLTLFFYLFLVATHVIAQTQAQDDSCFITREELKLMLGGPDMTLIDMRFGRDWTDATLKVKGAVREDPMKPGQWIEKYPKEKMLVFYWTWPKDVTSASLARILKNKGYTKVFALKGGFNEWVAANYPTEPK